MPLFRHTFSGLCAAGDQFSYSWAAQSIRSIADAHSAAIVWNQTLWNGATAGNGYKDHVTADVAMAQVKTTEFDPATIKGLAQRITGQTIAGVMAGVAMPADVAFVVSLRTDLPQRTGRGRFYLPQPAAGNLSGQGRATADMVNDVMASLAAAWAGYNTGVDRPVVFSPTFHVARPITSFNCGDLYDTQRRRENKVPEVRTSQAMP